MAIRGNTNQALVMGRMAYGSDGTNAYPVLVDSSGRVILSASTLAIGKLAANSGVDIGDVDVISVTPLEPLEVASQHGVAETADTNILAASITPTNIPCLFRIMVMLETAGVFSAILISGAVSKTLKMNAGNSLLADCAYMFDILVHSGDTVNFQTSASGNVTLRVQEIVAGGQ